MHAPQAFDGVYPARDLRDALTVIPAGRDATVTFRASGYATTITCTGAPAVTVTVEADWARGHARCDLTHHQLTRLIAALEAHDPTVWVHVDDGPITLSSPTQEAPE